MKISPSPLCQRGVRGDFHAKPRKEKGFILVILLALLLLLAVTAMSLNVRSGMQARMAANRTVDAQAYLDQLAVIEQSVWKLEGDPSWRVGDPSWSVGKPYSGSWGENYNYQGRSYSRRVTNSDVPNYTDVVTISIRTPNAPPSASVNWFLVNKSFRYNIDTAAVTGLNSPQGVAAYYDSTLKNLFLYIADSGNHCIWKLDTATNVINMVAGTTGLISPRGVATYYDSRLKNLFLYIADSGNHCIWKLDTVTSAISIVVNKSGIPTDDKQLNLGDKGQAEDATLNSPSGVAVVDTTGGFSIYIADMNNNRIRVVDKQNKIDTAGGTGTKGYYGENIQMALAQMNAPQGIFIDTNNANNDLYIADTGNHRIRKVSLKGNSNGIINTVAGNGTADYAGDRGAATSASINSPQGVSVDPAGNIYIADTGNHALRLVNNNNPGTINPGFISTLAGTVTSGYNGDNQPAVQARLWSPGGVALGLTKAGNRIYISDTNNNRIRVLFLKTEPRVYGP